MTREDRIRVWSETVNICSDGSYINKKGEKVEINTTLNQEDQQVFNTSIEDFIHNDKGQLNRYETVIEVVEGDCLYVAKDLLDKDKGYDVAVLNMASFIRPGGGVRKGSAAQEENLFRRTDLFEHLYRYDKQSASDYDCDFVDQAYPLDMNFGGIVSDHVKVFRGSEDVNYNLLDEPFEIDVITVSAPKHPKKFDEQYCKVMKNKISTILNLGWYNAVDSLVLGAFGCGAYGNPPELVAELFKEVLSEHKLKHYFKKIVFAIIDDHNAHKEHNPEGNLIPFKKVFETKKQ